MSYYNNNRSCSCDDSKTQENLARTYVIRQNSNSPTYDIETAFMKGTIFKDLDKPFVGGCKR